jgi:Transmembrane amino acid transporter protein
MSDNFAFENSEQKQLVGDLAAGRSSTFRSATGKMRYSTSVSFVGQHGLTTFTGILAVISTIIGGGILSIPYSFISFGIPLGILMNILAVVMVTISVKIYLAVKGCNTGPPRISLRGRIHGL